MKEICKVCKKPLQAGEENNICLKCKRKKQIALLGKLVKVGKVLAAGAVLGFKVLRKIQEIKKAETPSEDQKKEAAERGTSKSTVSYAPGVKYWNSETGRWEMDGIAYRYRVTYQDCRDGERHTYEYEDIDVGYKVYEYYRKQAYAEDVRWEHVLQEKER